MFKSIVIGGSGFLGSHLADFLSKKKHKVTIYDKKESSWKKKNQVFIKGNILNKKKLFDAIKNQDYVFMFAGLSDLDEALNKPIDSIKLNILATSYVAEACINSKVKRLIYASSVYSNSEEGGFYRCSKRSSEDYIFEYSKVSKLKFTILRYGSLYGPRSDKRNGLYKLLKNAINKKEVKYYGFPYNQRKYLHIHDSTLATYKILNKKYENKFINLYGNKIIKIKNLFKIFEKCLDFKIKTKYDRRQVVGHYIKKPTKLKIQTGITMKLKSAKGFQYQINKYIKYLEKNLL